MEETITNLQKFVGSAEEKRLVKGISFEFERQPDYFNVEIDNCNASKGVFFTQADVTLQYLTQYRLHSKLDLEVSPEDYCRMVSYDDIFYMNPLKEVVEKGLTSLCFPEYKDYAPAFLALLKFFKNIDQHQSALYQVMQTYEYDSHLTAALAYHLFSQLIPRHEYIVDKYSTHLPRVCPCSCKGTIKTGCTSLGSNDTWHGYVDMMLNQTIPVALLNKQETDSRDNNNIGSTTSGNKHEEKEMDESPIKRRRQDETHHEAAKSCDELLSLHAMDQIIAKTITNAFVQLRNCEDLHKWLIPTIGCSADSIIVFMYNPQHDFLIQSSRLMSLWCGPDSKKLNLGTVISIWMLINFKLFTKPRLNEKLGFKKSRFCECAGQSLFFYQNIETMDSFQDADICSSAVQHYSLVYRYLKPKGNEGANEDSVS
ncbi:hypothetical protein FSP39_022246 [Pinctada imbricata]|uniref:Uncharacterized protein n=1 Tax=Pinctada imbricata TaxID=66713 RepID=A0AA89BUV5_PINIB|nr:hypothetical protein FSP39_022246 [Pinctada imbricata]